MTGVVCLHFMARSLQLMAVGVRLS